MRRKIMAVLLLVVAPISSQGATQTQGQNQQAPIATQWVLDAVGPGDRATVEHVYMIVCPKTSLKGTGFLVDNGTIVSNEHVVRGCGAADVFAVSSFGNRIGLSALKVDAGRDLAALTPSQPIKGGLPLGSTAKLKVGSVIRTWGYPLGYNGPAPLLSAGYLSGFGAQQVAQNSAVKHLVVNAAFNSGNSGGPVFAGGENQVVGVVVSKALPLFTPFVQSAVQAFANNKSGVVFTGTDATGNPLSMVESQVVAEIVGSLRDMAQVMIGEAIAVEEVKAFLGYKSPSSKQPAAQQPHAAGGA